jgi:hypothetical protein
VKKAWLVFPLVLLLALTGCGKDDSTGLPSPASLTLEAMGTTVPLLELAADPAAYEDQWVQVSGQYSLLPVPPCDAAVHLPPATWSLIDDGVVVRMAGLENVLRPLASDGQTVVVEGYWRRWEGPVGCGNAAFPSTVWYLQVREILSPNPLVRATFTPMGAIAVATIPLPGTPAPSPTSGLPGPATAAPVGAGTATPTATPSATRLGSPLATPTGPFSPLPTLSPPASPTLNPSGTVLPTFTPQPDATGPSSPIATPQPTTSGTASPTATTQSTATSTRTPTPSATSAPAMLNLGEAVIGQVENGWLAAVQTHSWYYDAVAGEVITITVGPAGNVNVELLVNDPSGFEVAGRDNTFAGGAETLAGLELTMTGEYQILVSEVDGHPGDYAIVVLDRDSINVRFVGNMGYGTTRSTTLPARTYHIWHFQATAGDKATIRLAPTDNKDLAYTLYGPDMDMIGDRVDGGNVGFVEEATFQLQETGFYSILLEAYGTVEATYTLSLTDPD